jgi:hypothetical protein
MRRPRIVVVCGLFLLIQAATLAAAQPQVSRSDRSAYTAPTAPPLWVPARIAFTADGHLRPELFEPAFRSTLEKNAARNSDGGCRFALGAATSEEHSPKATLDDVVSGSLSILSGRVVSSEAGFYNGTPGELFRVAIEGAPKAMGHIPTSGIARLFVANATIKTSHGTICSRDPFAAVPQTGDHVVLFVSLEPNNLGRDIISVETRTQLVVEHDGALHAPALILRSVPTARSISDLIDAVRQNPHIQDVPRAEAVR